MEFDINKPIDKKVTLVKNWESSDIVKIIKSLKDSYKVVIFRDESGARKVRFVRYIFRGVSDSTYELLPTGLRKENEELFYLSSYGEIQDKSYQKVYEEFVDRVDDAGLFVPGMDYDFKNLLGKRDNLIQLNHSGTFFHTLALAQHYGIPTPLLDWTPNFDKALCFAVNRALKKMYKYFSSEHPSQEAGLEYLKTNKIALWGLEVTHANYGEQRPFLIIQPPRYGNPNMVMQEGIFTYWDTMYKNQDKCLAMNDDKLLDQIEVHFSPMLLKIEIEYIYIPAIWNQYLRRYSGITASSLFPGYEGIKEFIYEKAYFEKMNQIIQNILNQLNNDKKHK